ncbi:hypothetical protein V144x_31430 [Gimesia aquarii]|uniref:Uncharacterized protein n=1 Tax=Gimesia aquarii TaxID=2527964 RepID=A0A517VXD0_9PLAN|nr:hypothetical protein V144x_31430 [Gimesia aquarii]
MPVLLVPVPLPPPCPVSEISPSTLVMEILFNNTPWLSLVPVPAVPFMVIVAASGPVPVDETSPLLSMKTPILEISVPDPPWPVNEMLPSALVTDELLRLIP